MVIGVLYAATTRQRSRVTRARHLIAWECPSSVTADRNPARTHLRDTKGPHPSVTKPEEHFHFPTANWTAETDKGPTPPRFPRTSCSQCRLGSKIGKVYRQPQPDRSDLWHIINNLSDVLDRQKTRLLRLFRPKNQDFRLSEQCSVTDWHGKRRRCTP